MQSRAYLAMALFCGLPALAVFQRLAQVVATGTGVPAAALILALVGSWIVLAILVLRRAVPALRGPWNWQAPPDLLFLTGLCGLMVLYWYVYPLADSGQLGFYSDRDEAVDIGARRLLDGESPYTCRSVSGIHHGCPTQGNPILPLPGAMLLSMPFMALGGSASQVFLWLLVLYAALRSLLHQPHQAVLYLGLILVLSPVVLAEILTGGDLLSNTLAVSACTLLAINARTTASQLLFGALLGVALSWRAHFLLIAFPLAAFYMAHHRTRTMLRIAAATALAFSAVTLPVYLLEPGIFTPLQSGETLARFAHVLPGATIILPGLAAGLGLFLGARAGSLSALLYACSITVLLPVMGAIVLNSIEVGHPTFLFYGWYALSGLVFGTLAATLDLVDSDRRR